jgi:hypothetical protein
VARSLAGTARGVDDELASSASKYPARPAVVTILRAAGRRSEAQPGLGALGMRTVHFTTGDGLAGQLAALGVAA